MSKYIIILLAFSLFSISAAKAQESLRDRLERRQQAQQANSNSESAIPRISTRAEMLNKEQERNLANATWIREIYRELDLTKGKNAALYYPVQPVGKQMNLITMIFKLMGEGNLVAYNWNSGQDRFTDNLIVNFEDILKDLEIPYQKNGNVYAFDDYSIPGNEVMKYYIKEAWYFDQSNSQLGVKTIAICPVLARQEYFDDANSGTTAYNRPLFWIPYENIRPYAARMPIMTSDLNNVMNKTVDDYFNMRLYEGDIYKTTNMENVYLTEKFKTPEELEYARDSIEKQLRQFDKGLWVINDSIETIFREGAKKTKAKKSKPDQPKSSSSSATYSARDRRN
jgi:gliding motility associated protien GldN